MLKAGNYDWVNPDITEDHFPVNPSLYTAEGSKPFHFNRVMTTSQVEKAIRAEGYEPDPIEKLLAYGAKNPEEQRKYPIVALGSSWVNPRGYRFVPYLFESGRERGVYLNWGGPENQWDENCRFLGSRKPASIIATLLSTVSKKEALIIAEALEEYGSKK